MNYSVLLSNSHSHCNAKEGSWADLKSFLLHPLKRPPTKGGRSMGWSPTLFRDGYRNKDNALTISCMVLDLDKGAPELFTALWSHLNDLGLTYAAHPTYQHTEDAPRWRVIIPLVKEVTELHDWSERYLEALKDLAPMMNPDTSCQDSSRYYFRYTGEGGVKSAEGVPYLMPAGTPGGIAPEAQTGTPDTASPFFNVTSENPTTTKRDLLPGTNVMGTFTHFERCPFAEHLRDGHVHSTTHDSWYWMPDKGTEGTGMAASCFKADCRALIERNKLSGWKLLRSIDDNLRPSGGELKLPADESPTYSTKKGAIKWMNERWGIYETSEGTYINLSNGSQLKASGFNLSTMNLPAVWNPELEKYEAVSKVWMQSPHKSVVTEFVFRPSQPPGFNSCTGVYNLWTGLIESYAPNGRTPTQVIEPWLTHVKEVWCNGDEALYDYLIKLWAWMVQKVGYPRPGVFVVATGKQGTGKTVVVEMLSAMFGEHGCSVSDWDSLVGKHSELPLKVFVGFNEPGWGHSNLGKLKSLTTDATMRYEPKFQKPVDVENHLWFIQTTNATRAQVVEESNRRFLILEVSDKYGPDKVSYYDTLWHLYFGDENQRAAGEGPAALLSHLQSLDLTDYRPRDIPTTQATVEAIAQNPQDSVTRWLLQMLSIPSNTWGSGEIDGTWVGTEEKWQKVQTGHLFSNYIEFCKSQGIPGHDREANSAIGLALREKLGAVKSRSGKHGRRWGFRDAAYHRNHFADYYRNVLKMPPPRELLETDENDEVTHADMG